MTPTMPTTPIPKPCPFCLHTETTVQCDKNTHESYVECTHCHARGPTTNKTFVKNMAVDLWNES